MFYEKKNNHHLNTPKTDNKEIYNVAVIKYIGVLLDKDLSFQQNAESVGKN